MYNHIKIIDNQSLWDIIDYNQKSIKKKWNINGSKRSIPSFWNNLDIITKDCVHFFGEREIEDLKEIKGFCMYNDNHKLVCYLIFDKNFYNDHVVLEIIETIEGYRNKGYAKELIKYFEYYIKDNFRDKSIIKLCPVSKVKDFWIHLNYICDNCSKNDCFHNKMLKKILK